MSAKHTELGLNFLDAVQTGELSSTEQEQVHLDYMRSLYVLIKSAFVFDTNNAALSQAAGRLANTANRILAHSEEAAALELMADGAYVNRSLVKLDVSSYDQFDYLFTVFSTLGVSEISAVAETTPEDWLELVTAFKIAVGPEGDFRAFSRTELRAIHLTALEGQGGNESALAVTDRFRALRAYAITVITLAEQIDNARTGKRLRPARVKRPLQEMVALAREHRSLLLALAHLKRHKLTHQHHLTNTAVFVVCCLAPFDLNRRMVCEIGLQAAFHDVGRAFAAGAPGTQGPHAEQEFALQATRKLVSVGSAHPRVLNRVVVANEVRRWVDRDLEPPGDTPYPFELGTATKLIAVAHAYSLLTTPRPDRPCLLADEALRVILRDAGRRYDAVSAKLMVNTLGVYPVGSTVALSDGQVAVVVEAPHEAAGPTRPRIKVVRDGAGNLVDGALIDLGSDVGADLRIVRCIDAEEYEINPPAFLLS